MSASNLTCRHGLHLLSECWRCDRGDVLAVLLLARAAADNRSAKEEFRALDFASGATDRPSLLSPTAGVKRAAFEAFWAGDGLEGAIASEEARMEFEEAREAVLEAVPEVTACFGPGWRSDYDRIGEVPHPALLPPALDALDNLWRANDRWQKARAAQPEEQGRASP